MLSRRLLVLTLCCTVLVAMPCRAADSTTVTVDSATVELRGVGAVYSLLVQKENAVGLTIDLTRVARFESGNPGVATVSPDGIVAARGDGETTIRVSAEGQMRSVAVRVQGTTEARQVTYARDVLPIFSRHSCNSSGCHGKAEGQNGFKLSVFGFDPAADMDSLVHEARGRRIFQAAPEQSLLLRKMSGAMPHGGGARIRSDTSDYETVRAWIAAGTPAGSAKDPVILAVRVQPAERLLWPGEQQQLRVVARTSAGQEIDVTAHARFQSNNENLATVQPSGLVSAGDVPGEAAVMTSFMNEVAICRVIVPRTQPLTGNTNWAASNFIDQYVNKKLRKLNIQPSEQASDTEYLRRVYLDIIGTLPTPAEARRFLADTQPDRRARLVDELLERPEYADYAALQWSDVLRVDRGVLGPKRAHAYQRWIHARMAANTPLDQLARDLITAEGPLAEVSQGAFYQVVQKPGEMASTLSQVFLGVRIACAECHHHPFDRWTQEDYHGLVAYFTPVAVRPGPLGETLSAQGQAVAGIVRTGVSVPAHALGTPLPTKASEGQADPRVALAEWLTRSDNPWFTRHQANRLWAHYLGRGLVEPVDDVRATNPPTNPELLDALAQHLVQSHYDAKALIRVITASQAYQRASRPNTTNERDEQNYSHAEFKRIPAEVLCDMVSQTTGVPERFWGMPVKTRAIQLWDSKVPHYFLRVFGRPERLSSCQCERNQEPSVAQVLHLLNAPEIQARIGHASGLVSRLATNQPDDRQVVEELYLTCYSRPPTSRELHKATDYLHTHQAQRRQAIEDLLWSQLNSLEFLFNH